MNTESNHELPAHRDATSTITVTDDRGTVAWVPFRGRRRSPEPDGAHVAGGWLFGPPELIAAVRDILGNAETAEYEVRYGAWAQMPTDRDSLTAVLIAMLLTMPSGTVGESLWDYVHTETVPEGAIR